MNWGPSRGAAGESGKPVILRQAVTVPRELHLVEARPVRIGEIIVSVEF
jgi:hypothetical protein